MKAKSLVVMPTYNEIENLEHSVTELFRFNSEIDLLIVDDNSPDGTAQLADRLAKSDQRIRVLHRAEKLGLGPAYVAAFEYAFKNGYEFVIEMDADGSHRASDLPKLIEKAKSADLVIGSRWVRGGQVQNWPISRKLISKLGNLYVRAMLGTPVRDMTAGFRIFRIEFLKQLNLHSVASHGYSFQVEMAWRAIKQNGRVVEMPIIFVERELGHSKMNSKIVLEALLLVTKWGLLRFLKTSKRS